uniref:hypothetical protein n=1 Tax=Pseudomonas sp. TaxID=306 RepID=UPI0010BB68CD|nr:hypothetical protein [Pseudomonas sp.]QBM91787.1 hypothetical protein pA22BJ1_p02 [Pseudomonas sp.]
MATAYPIVPADWLDELVPLNTSLEAYQTLLNSWIRCAISEGIPPGSQAFLAGLNLLFEPILSGYQKIQCQVQQAREMGLVGIAFFDSAVPEG